MSHAAHDVRHMLQHLPVEPVAAIVLSAAGVLTSFASYQASLWDGAQIMHYSRAGQARQLATEAALDASLTRAIEIDLFTAWVEANAQGDQRLAGFYRARFPADLGAAFSDWLAQRPFENPKAEPSPFTLPSYRQPGRAVSAAFEVKAEVEFETAMKAKQTADAHERAAVILAGALFFGGISQVFKRQRVRFGLIVIAFLGLVSGAIQIFSLPLMSLHAH